MNIPLRTKNDSLKGMFLLFVHKKHSETSAVLNELLTYCT